MRIMVDMSATLLHYGHVRLLKQAKDLGHVVVGLTTDEEVFDKKGYRPEMSFDERKEILEALACVDEVVPTPWLIDQAVLDQHKIDLLLHGDDNSNRIDPDRLKIVSRTQGISSQDLRLRALDSLVAIKNRKKLLTPGPGRLLSENLRGLVPSFGRGDVAYDALEDRVLTALRQLTGHRKIARMQGAASFALEVATINFLQGRCLVIDSGYYAKRLLSFAQNAQAMGYATQVDVVSPKGLAQVSGPYDWVIGVYTETASALKNDLSTMRQLADRVGARLMLDATGSIGLEDDHDLADVVCYSSCKGLLGLTGAAFIAFNSDAQNEVRSFNLSLDTHLEKKCTGPYHAIASLDQVLAHQPAVRQSVVHAKSGFMKRFSDRMMRPEHEQPNLCTLLRGRVSAVDEGVVLYQPRDHKAGTSVLCHLGEASTDGIATGDVIKNIRIE